MTALKSGDPLTLNRLYGRSTGHKLRPGQQALVDISGQYVPHAQAKPKPGRRLLEDIKFMKDDPAAVLTRADEIKAKYTAIFKV